MNDADLVLLLVFGASPALKLIAAGIAASLLFAPALWAAGALRDWWTR